MGDDADGFSGIGLAYRASAPAGTGVPDRHVLHPAPSPTRGKGLSAAGFLLGRNRNTRPLQGGIIAPGLTLARSRRRPASHLGERQKNSPSAQAIVIFRPMPPRRRTSKDTPSKLAKRMSRRWRVVLLRAKGEILCTVEAPDVAAAKAAAAVQFDLDEIQRNRIMVQELA